MNTLLETEKYKAHIYDVIGAIHEVVVLNCQSCRKIYINYNVQI